MKPSAPSKMIWIAGLILGILGILGHYSTIDLLTANNYLLLLAGFILLALGTSFKQL